MRFWCAASQGVPWEWAWQAYPGVWAFLILLAVGYVRLLRRVPTAASTPARRRQVRYFGVGIATLWVALDWPLGPLGMGYLASVHMVQFVLVALAAPALLLLGIPHEAFEAIRQRPRLLALLRNTTQPLVAFFLFNVIMTVTHWPDLVDPLMASQVGAFLLDVVWLASGLIFWWPLLAPVPEWPRFSPPFQLGYLGLNGILIRPPFLMLLFADYPVYATYELAPPLPGISALGDQQLAAGVMKLGTAFAMVVAMALVFHAWARSQPS